MIKLNKPYLEKLKEAKPTTVKAKTESGKDITLIIPPLTADIRMVNIKPIQEEFRYWLDG